MAIQVGDVVVLRSNRILVGKCVNPEQPRNGPTATVVCFLQNTSGGVYLDRELAGFRCWNVADLRKVAKRNGVT